MSARQRPQPFLSQMPWNIKQQIIDSSVVQMRPAIRRLNQGFKALVDDSAVTYYRLSVEYIKSYSQDVVKIALETENSDEHENNFYVEFHHHQEGYRVVKGNWDEAIVKVCAESGELPFINRAALHLAKILKNPKLRFQELLIKAERPNRYQLPETIEQYKSGRDVFIRKLKKTLEQLGHQLNVESLEIELDGAQDDFLAVLKRLKAKTLKCIFLGDTERARSSEGFAIDRLVQTDQWKQAETMWTNKNIEMEFSALTHFDSLDVTMKIMTLEQFKDILQFYTNKPSFLQAAFECDYDRDAFRRYLSQFPRHGPIGLPIIGWKLPIPNSSEFLYVHFGSNRRISIQIDWSYRKAFCYTNHLYWDGYYL